jgi:hypothetical protein
MILRLCFLDSLIALYITNTEMQITYLAKLQGMCRHSIWAFDIRWEVGGWVCCIKRHCVLSPLLTLAGIFAPPTIQLPRFSPGSEEQRLESWWPNEMYSSSNHMSVWLRLPLSCTIP